MLSTLKTEGWTLFVVANGNDPKAVRENSVKKVVRKAFQVCPAEVPQVRVESQRGGSSGLNVFI